MALPINLNRDGSPVGGPLENGYQQIGQAASVHAQLRDRQIDLIGKPVVFTIPIAPDGDVISSSDFFGDTVDQTEVGINAQELHTKIIPLYSAYYTMVDLFGRTAGQDVPLEVMVKSNVELPRGSRVTLDLDFNDQNHGVQNIEFEVSSVTVKHIENMYSRTASLVPKRGPRADDAGLNTDWDPTPAGQSSSISNGWEPNE